MQGPGGNVWILTGKTRRFVAVNGLNSCFWLPMILDVDRFALCVHPLVRVDYTPFDLPVTLYCDSARKKPSRIRSHAVKTHTERVNLPRTASGAESRICRASCTYNRGESDKHRRL